MIRRSFVGTVSMIVVWVMILVFPAQADEHERNAEERSTGSALLGIPSVSPDHLIVGSVVSMIVSVKVTKPRQLAGSVKLQRLDAKGRVQSLLGILHDDGRDGDAAAGDHLYSLRMSMNEVAAGQIQFRISAQFKNEDEHATSRTFSLNVLPPKPTPTLYSPRVDPTEIPAGVARVGVFSATVNSPDGALPNSIWLQRRDLNGLMLANLGPLHDDGRDGDTAAADRTYGIQTTIFEDTPGLMVYRIAATFDGLAQPVYSSALTVNITGTQTGIRIVSPVNGVYVNTPVVTFVGTVGDDAAQVNLNGIATPVSGHSFAAAVPLNEGPNTITAVAANSGGSTSTSHVLVTLDTTPPRVEIYSPTPLSSTVADSVTVTGLVNDIVVGTVNPLQATVSVNGVVAEVLNRSFRAANVALGMGANALQAVATDRAGNRATTTVNLTRLAATAPSLRIESGNDQIGPAGSDLPAPLVVKLVDGQGRPQVDQSVVWRVVSQDGSFIAPAGLRKPVAALVVSTDSQGLASVNFRLGSRAGAGNNLVEASAVGLVSTAVFSASASPGAAQLVVVDSGNNQTGVVGQALPLPMIASVTDTNFNRLSDVPVTFQIKSGGGHFDGSTAFQTRSDADGRIAASLTLGPDPGVGNNIVEASFVGNTSFAAAFSATAMIPGPADQTRISGVVLDNSNQPIPGVMMRLLQINQGQRSNIPQEMAAAVATDSQGQFLMQPVPVGVFKLMADGGSAQRAGFWPTLEYDLITVAGQNNGLGMPIYLPELRPENRICVNETTGGTLTIPAAPGFALTISAGSATFPGGSRTGCVSVTPVNLDKVPMSPGFGQQPRFIVTIQPVGAHFNPPARMTIPNVDGLPPRAVTEMYSYDHDLATFVAIGSATVSADGSTIISDPGSGVIKAGWHCGGNPNLIGSAGSCQECQQCGGSFCLPNPSKEGLSCQSKNRQRGKCTNGYCDPIGRVDILEPIDGKFFRITAEPRMPQLEAKAKIFDVDPDPTATSGFSWSLGVDYKGPDGRTTSLTYLLPNKIGGTWTPYDPAISPIRGGDVSLYVTTERLQLTLADHAVAVSILGNNPSRAEVNAALGGFPATNIACLESGKTLGQFNMDGLPKFGAPNGYGIMQVDNPPVSEDGIWNWRVNVAEGLAILSTKRNEARRYANQIQLQFNNANVPDFCAQGTIDQSTNYAMCDLEIIQRYNGGRYWHWVNVIQNWVASPRNNYVSKVLAAVCN